MLMDSFVNIEGTGNLLVLKTLPGNAQSIGAILDQIDWDEVLYGMIHAYLFVETKKRVKKSKLEFSIYYKDAMNLCYKPYQ